MAVTLSASGTQSCTVTTEFQVADTAVAGVYTFHIDTNPLAAGDVLEVRVYQMIITGGTSRPVYMASYAGVQPADDLIKISPAIGNDLTDATALRFSLKQTFGTARSIPWKVLKY